MFLGSAKQFAARTRGRGANWANPKIPNFLPSSSRRAQGVAARTEQIQFCPSFCQEVRGAHKGSRRELAISENPKTQKQHTKLIQKSPNLTQSSWKTSHIMNNHRIHDININTSHIMGLITSYHHQTSTKHILNHQFMYLFIKPNFSMFP